MPPEPAVFNSTDSNLTNKRPIHPKDMESPLSKKSDPELADGIKWLDSQAQKKGITFYDMVFEVLYSHDVNSKAQNWLKTRN